MPGWRAEARTSDRFVLAALGLGVTCVTMLGIAAHATYGRESRWTSRNTC